MIQSRSYNEMYMKQLDVPNLKCCLLCYLLLSLSSAVLLLVLFMNVQWCTLSSEKQGQFILNAEN